MNRRHRIAATLATLAASTALSLAVTGTASAQEENPLMTPASEEDSIILIPQYTLETLVGSDDGTVDPDSIDGEAVEDAHEEAVEEAQEAHEEGANIYGLYGADGDELDNLEPDTSVSPWQVDW